MEGREQAGVPDDLGQRASLPNKDATAQHHTRYVASPEFEFWMVRNPAFPQPQIHSADELFVNGMLLPLHLLRQPDRHPDSGLVGPGPRPEPESEASSIASVDLPATSSSKRWKDIFKMGEKKISNKVGAEKEKDKKKKDRKSSSSSSGAATELNINIWPFSRSRSAGNAAGRPRAVVAAGRKACSAPCSRSNSGGDSKSKSRVEVDECGGSAAALARSKKWPASPGRVVGVHVGRNSPVRPHRRHGGGSGGGGPSKNLDAKFRDPEKVRMVKERSDVCRRNSAIRALNVVNVPLCIGYRHNLSCNSDDNNSSSNSNTGSSNANGTATLFNLRSIFSKKVY